jgi:hypothetical protein
MKMIVRSRGTMMMIVINTISEILYYLLDSMS